MNLKDDIHHERLRTSRALGTSELGRPVSLGILSELGQYMDMDSETEAISREKILLSLLYNSSGAPSFLSFNPPQRCTYFVVPALVQVHSGRLALFITMYDGGAERRRHNEL